MNDKYLKSLISKRPHILALTEIKALDFQSRE